MDAHKSATESSTSLSSSWVDSNSFPRSGDSGTANFGVAACASSLNTSPGVREAVAVAVAVAVVVAVPVAVAVFVAMAVAVAVAVSGSFPPLVAGSDGPGRVFVLPKGDRPASGPGNKEEPSPS